MSSYAFAQELRTACSSISEGPESYSLVTEDLDSVTSVLKKYGMEYSVRDSQAKKRKLLWSSKNIEYCGTPFFILKSSYLQCVHGQKYYSSHSKENDHGKQKRIRLKRSKKIGCPASMKVIIAKYFPTFKATPGSNRAQKEEALRSLQEKLQEKGYVESEYRFIIQVSKPSNHSHQVSTTCLTQTSVKSLKVLEPVATEFVSPQPGPSTPDDNGNDPGGTARAAPASGVSSRCLSRLREKIRNIHDLSYLLPANDLVGITSITIQLEHIEEEMKKMLNSNNT